MRSYNLIGFIISRAIKALDLHTTFDDPKSIYVLKTLTFSMSVSSTNANLNEFFKID